MMRSGRLLAEDSPDNLLRNYNLFSLENVFLELCMKNQDNKPISIFSNDSSCNQTEYTKEQPQLPSEGIDNKVFDSLMSDQLNSPETNIAIERQNGNNYYDSQLSNISSNSRDTYRVCN